MHVPMANGSDSDEDPETRTKRKDPKPMFKRDELSTSITGEKRSNTAVLNAPIRLNWTCIYMTDGIDHHVVLLNMFSASVCHKPKSHW
jgi:hypothetical protein